MHKPTHVTLAVPCEAGLARLVRMTAANVATLSSMSVERVEDIRMAAEEAFVCACAAAPGSTLSVAFDADDSHVAMAFELDVPSFACAFAQDPAMAYADLILGSVCDSYEKLENPAVLHLDMKADI